VNRGLLHLLLYLLLAFMGTPAWAHCRPENRVGGSPVFSSDFTFADDANPVGTPTENPACGYDFASGVHKYLYVQDDPVNFDDPSGLDPQGHHLVPRSLWKNASQRVQDIWDDAKNRLDAKRYKLHNGKTYGKVTRDEYAKAVEKKLEKFVKSKGKTSFEQLGDKELQGFANEIRSTAEGPIAEYNEAVAQEILSTTVEGAATLAVC